jgi:hypothetical protein
LTVLYLHRFFRALVAGVIVVGGFALAGPPVAASTAAPQLAGAICGTKAILSHAAPGVGKSATFTLPTAGSVTLVEQSTTSLMVTLAKPTSGWKATIITASGTPVHVGFQQVKYDNEQERFWARLNAKGTTITTTIQTCT